MIKVSGVIKSFDSKKRVLDSIDLHVKKGSIYGLVGVNGSGKTTIIKHLTGVLKPDAGTIEIMGEPIYENNNVKEKNCIRARWFILLSWIFLERYGKPVC